jgi:rRNA maturation protein Nop10
MKKLRKCAVCGNYTIHGAHCGKPSVSGHPAAYDPNDRYGDYRRKWKGCFL